MNEGSRLSSLKRRTLQLPDPNLRDLSEETPDGVFETVPEDILFDYRKDPPSTSGQVPESKTGGRRGSWVSSGKRTFLVSEGVTKGVHTSNSRDPESIHESRRRGRPGPSLDVVN